MAIDNFKCVFHDGVEGKSPCSTCIWAAHRLEKQNPDNEFPYDASEFIGDVDEFIHALVPSDWRSWPRERRRDYLTGGAKLAENTKMIRRDLVCVEEIAYEKFGIDKTDVKYKTVNRGIKNALIKLGCKPVGPRNLGVSYPSKRAFSVAWGPEFSATT